MLLGRSLLPGGQRPVYNLGHMDDPALSLALRRHFGHETFREGQQDVIAAVLGGRDCLAVMPTGGGKSLCYQLPALLRPGVTLVVSPLIALMQDQVSALLARGIPATFLNSSLSGYEMSERLGAVAAGRFRLVYVAPERFRSAAFQRVLGGVPVSLFAVDEAHCVSLWGHDFRPDYLRLREALASLGEPQVLALTATATPEVRQDIAAQLGFGAPPRAPAEVVVRGFGRPGLTLAVSRTRGREQKLARLLELLGAHRVAIVYCATRRSVEWVAAELAARRLRCLPYHAGLSDERRRAAQDRFIAAEVDVVVATNAFGMGIDRADVRALVHWEIPGSLEAYYQEAGRAGRDGLPAWCEILFSGADVRTQEFFLEGANPPPALVREVAALVRAAAQGPARGPGRGGSEGDTLTAAAIAEVLGDGRRGNAMAVETALGLLGRLGALERVQGKEGGDDAWAAGPDPEAPRVEDLARLEEKAQRDRARLRRLLAFVGSADCRHATILRYFGDPQSQGICLHRCDNCLARGRRPAFPGPTTGAGGDFGAALAPTPSHEPSESEWLQIQKALSAVARLGGRFGRLRVAQVLAGSRDQAVLRAGLETLPTYGSLKGTSLVEIRDLLDALEATGCVEAVGDEYPVLRLTPIGAEVMHRREAIRLPGAPPRAAQDPATAAAAATGTERPSGSKKKKAQAALAAGQDGDTLARFEALRAWRREEAQSRGVPAYLVLPDRTLLELARACPRRRDDLIDVKGIGPGKLARYGDALLTLLSHLP